MKTTPVLPARKFFTKQNTAGGGAQSVPSMKDFVNDAIAKGKKSFPKK